MSIIHGGHSTATKVVYGMSKAKLSLLSMVLKYGGNPNHVFKYEGDADRDLEYGGNLDYFEEDRTPLMHVARGYLEQAVEMCEILILHGVDINARNSKDETVLHFATENRNIEIIQLLLSHGANVNAQDHNGESALHIAARKLSSFSTTRICHKVDIQELLLQSGADPIIKNRAGNSPSHDFLIMLCKFSDPPVSLLEDHIQLFTRFGPSSRDLIVLACENGEVMKLAAGLKDVAILKVLLSYGGASSDVNIRECTYSSLDHTRPRSLQLLIQHANPFRVANNKHMAFLFLIKISRELGPYLPDRPDSSIPMEIRVKTAKPLTLRYSGKCAKLADEYCDILKYIWDAGFDANTILDENFANLVSSYRDEFVGLVQDVERFDNLSSPDNEGTISAVVFAAQHVASAAVVLALLDINSHRDNLTDEGKLEVLIRAAVYGNLGVYEGCRGAYLGKGDEDNIESICQFSRCTALGRIAKAFPSSNGQRIPDFYRELCRAVRREGFERKKFSDGRTLFDLAERAGNHQLLDALNGDERS